MTLKWPFIFLVAFNSLLFCTKAQSQGPTFNNVAKVIQQYDYDSGLSQVTVNSLAEDQFGYIWMGTQSGLNRFDGKNFKHFYPSPDGLAGGFIKALCTQGDNLWVGTQTGLSIYSQIHGTFTSLLKKDYANIPSDKIRRLQCTQDIILVVTDEGSYVVNSKTRQIEVHEHDGFLTVSKDAYLVNDDLYYRTEQGIWRVAAGNNNAQLVLPGQFGALVVQNGYLLVLKSDGNFLLMPLNDLTAQVEIVVPKDRPAQIFELSISSKDVIIATTIGAFQFNLKGELLNHLEPQRDNDTLLDSVLAAYRDSTGNIWFGTENNGVFHFRTLSKHFGHIDKLTANNGKKRVYDIRGFALDKDNLFWVATSKELHIYSDSKFKLAVDEFPSLSILNGSLITDLLTFEDTLWIATRGAGLVKLNLKTGEVIGRRPKLTGNQPSINFNNINLYKNQVIASSRSHGLIKLDATIDKFVPFFSKAQSPPQHTSYIMVDGENLWFGSIGDGLFKFDGQALHSITKEQGLSSDLVLMLELDTHDRVWAATDNGINIVSQDLSLIKQINTEQGLANNAVWTLIKDNNEDMWLGTSGGLSVIDHIDFSVNNYARTDGVQSSEFNFNAAAKMSDGKLFLGGANGFNQFYPYNIKRQYLKPVIHLNDIKILGLARDNPVLGRLDTVPELVSLLSLSAEESTLSLSYSKSAIRAKSADKIYYRVIGLTDKWLELEESRSTIDLINLSSGKYIVEVQSKDRFGTRSNPHQLHIKVASFWWASHVAISFYILCVALIIFFMLRNRVKRFQQIVRDNRTMRLLTERFELSLWASEDELWDWHITKNKIYRFGIHQKIDYGERKGENLFGELRRYVHPEDCLLIEEKLKQCIDGTINSYEVTIRLKDFEGNWCWMRDRGKVVRRGGNGKAERIAGGLQDIKELKSKEIALEKLNYSLEELNRSLEEKVKHRTIQLEENNAQLVQTLDELEQTQNYLIESEKMASLGNLVAGVAHEINTPLGIAITGVSTNYDGLMQLESKLENKTLNRTNLSNAITAQKTAYELVNSNLERAKYLIANFKKVAVDQSNEQIRELNFHDYLTQVFMSLSSMINEKDIKVIIDCPEDLVVHSFSSAWHQILSNLIQNSCKHGFEGIESGTIRVNVFIRDGDKLLVVYQDDGVGVLEKVHDKMFEPFVTTKRNQGGSGLGMHIVYNLVTQVLKGEIASLKVNEQGALFEIISPLYKAQEDEAEEDMIEFE